MSENLYDAPSVDLDNNLEEKIGKMKTACFLNFNSEKIKSKSIKKQNFKGIDYLKPQRSIEVPNDINFLQEIQLYEPSSKSEKELIFSTEKYRKLFPHSSNSKYIPNSIKSSKGFYDVIARFYLAKKFINSLRAITSTRSIKFLTENNLKMINDPIYFTISKEISKFRILLTEYYFDPSSWFTLTFTFLNFIMMGFYFAYIPLALCVLTPDNKNDQYLNRIKTIFFGFLIADVFRRLNTAYYKKGLLVTNKKFILRKYAKRYLIFDFLSLIPLSIIELSLKTTYSEFFLILFYFKLKHFNQLILKFEKVILMNSKLNHILSLFKLVGRLIFLSHIFACLWFYVGKTTFYENTWIKVNQLEDQPDSYIFLYSYYFVCVTMNTVGYGEIHPTNPLEILFTIVFIYVACILFAYTLNSIGLILENINKSQKEYLKEVNLANSFMREKNINFDLRIRVRKYFEYIWTEEKIHKANEEANVIKKLSDSLKEEVYFEAYGHIIRNVKFLSRNFSEESLRKVVPILKERRYTPDDLIFLDDDLKDYDLYIITKGSVELFISAGSNQSYTTVKKLEAGNVFGEFAFITGHPRKTGARSIDFTTIYCIKQDEFLHIIKKNKIDYENYCRMRDSILLYDDYSLMHTKCSSCKLGGHLVGKCPIIHYTPPTDIILRRYNYSEDQVRMLNYGRSELKKRFIIKRDFHLIKNSVLFFQKNNAETLESAGELNEDESLKGVNFDLYSSLKSRSLNLNFDDPVQYFNDNEVEEDNHELKAPSLSDIKIFDKVKSKSSHEENVFGLSKSRNLDEINDEHFPQVSSMVFNQKKNLHGVNISSIMDLMKKCAAINQDKDKLENFPFNVDIDIMKNYSCYFPRNNVEIIVQEIKKALNHKLVRRKSFLKQKSQNCNEEKKKVKKVNRTKILENFKNEEELDPINLKNYFKKLYQKKNIFKKIWEYLVEIYSFCFFKKKKVIRLNATRTMKSLRTLKNK